MMHGCIRSFARVALAFGLLWSPAFVINPQALLAEPSSVTDLIDEAHQGVTLGNTSAGGATRKSIHKRPPGASARSRTRPPRSTSRTLRLPKTTQPRLHQYPSENALTGGGRAAGFPNYALIGEPRVLETWKIRLVDGDTFWYGGERIRVRGYDAPERSESGGVEAMHRLDNLLHEGQVVIIPRATDVYGRTVADVYVDTRNVADVMTTEGYVKPGRPPRN